ncbi:MAG: lipopolysaccharide biosynthesis protein [Chitinophagaceae bacterium]|nr:lipopolysaccharide biosynthesis protein [Chitinophagaceae bacterium]
MGIIKRQSLKTSMVNYAGVLLGMAFFNFVFPHLLSEEYLGLIGLLQYMMYVLSPLPALGLAHVMYKYYSTWKETDTLPQFNAFSILVMAVASLLFAGLFFIFHEPILHFYKARSALFIPYYFLIIPLVVIQVYNQYFEMYCTMKLRVAFPAFLREIVSRLLLIILIFLFIYQFLSEKQFIYGLVLVYLLSLLILLFYTIRGLDFKAFSPLKYWQNNPKLKEQLGFGGGMLLVSGLFSLHNFLDGILIPAFLGLGAFGIYARPLVLGQMIHVPFRAISQISLPIIREAWVQGDLKKIRDLNKSTGLIIFLIGSFLFTLLVVSADALFLLLPEKYSIAKPVLYIIALGRLADMAFGLNTEILYASKYYRYIVYLSLVVVLMTIGLNFMLIPPYGMNGAAMAVSISLIIFNILKTSLIYYKFNFHCFSRHYITLLIISGLIIFLVSFIPDILFVKHHKFLNPCLNIFFRSGVAAVLFLIPVYVLQISKDFNDFVKLALSGKIFKGGHKMNEL